ncbi:GDSL-type esterase/lipase family protein [Halarcobacter sp.]|uniref:GDSL-type esterase/lipase family protein n=1 Tax=Halarcobacter sp. TaxID=2321133 RepID=UPI002AAB4BD5|nr:GDSL-type esterase/lipase family protein [Halarcobacter sp.]
MKKTIEVVMLGDSLTARGDWKKLLENNFVINLGIDGDNTLGVLNKVNQAIELEPKIICLMIGINDLCLSVPLEKIFDNYKKIVDKIVKKNIKIIVQAVLVTQMPAVNKKVHKLNNMIKEYCESNNIKMIDFNYAFSNEKGLLKEDLTTDGLHLGQKAYKVWGYKLKNSILQTN